MNSNNNNFSKLKHKSVDLKQSIKKGALDKIQEYLEENLEAINDAVSSSRYGKTLLFYAVEFGQLEIVKYLLLREADVNKPTNRKLYPYFDYITPIQMTIYRRCELKTLDELENNDKIFNLLLERSNEKTLSNALTVINAYIVNTYIENAYKDTYKDMKTLIEKKLQSISSALPSISGESTLISNKQTSTTSKEDLQKQIQELQKLNVSLTNKVLDLEDHSRQQDKVINDLVSTVKELTSRVDKLAKNKSNLEEKNQQNNSPSSFKFGLGN